MALEKSSIYESTYKSYLAQVNAEDFAGKEDVLGIRVRGNEVIVPFFGRRFCVTAEHVLDDLGREPHFAVNVVLCKYLIHYQGKNPAGQTDPDTEAQWVSYRDFKDSAPLVNYFSNNTEKAIARNFSGRTQKLAAACRALGGDRIDKKLSYDLTMQVTPLPRVPIFLLFNDADDEFGAEASVLFERRAEKYLDMECLAIVGWLFSDYLMQAAGGSHSTLL